MKEFTDLLTQLLSNPIFWILVICYYTFNALVGAMDMPTPQSSPLYRFTFRFLNKLAANLDRAAKAIHVPGTDLPDTSKGQP